MQGNLQKSKAMIWKIIGLSLSLTLLLAATASYGSDAPNGQSRTVTGTITSAVEGDALPGVSVVLKGTSTGTVSDVDGNYRINVDGENSVLVFSYVGYVTEEIQVNNRSVIDLVMMEDVTQLSEIVIVDDGYGTMKKSDLTGSVASLTGKDLKRAPVANVAEAMTGRIPGVKIQAMDGSPDSEMVIRIRGGNSITQDNSPLYVVDGFIVSSIRDIPPSDIVSIDVLKDAAATAIYGAQASNGVIVINTRKPEAGKISVSYNAYGQMNRFPEERKYNVLSPYEYVMANYEHNKLKSEADLEKFERFYGKYEDLELYQFKPATDWQDELFGQPRFSQSHNLSISGGTDQTKMVLSLTHNDDDGLIEGSGRQRSVINFKLNQSLSESLTLDASARITNSIIDGAGTSGTAQLRIKDAVQTRPVNGIADELELDLGSVTDGDYQSYLLSLIAPTELAEQDWRKRTSNSYVLNAGLNWALFERMNLRSVFTTETEFDERLRYYGPLTGESQKEGGSLPLGVKEDIQRTSFRWLNTLGYVFEDLGPHSLNLLLGQEIYSIGGQSSMVRAEEFRESMKPEELFANMWSGTTVEQSTKMETDRNRLSFFGRANYQLFDKYLFTATFRADASSRFSDANRWGIFPAVAFGWKLSDEDFMAGLRFVDDMKLRISYGETGNDGIPPNSTVFLFGGSTNDGPGMGTNDYNPYYLPINEEMPNPDLKWETTVNRNLGLDFSLFAARLNGSVDFYYNTTRDLLLPSAISPISGFESQWMNIGSTLNKGIEVALNGYLVDNQDFSLSANFNMGFNRSEIVELDGTDERFFQSNWGSTDLKDRNDYYFKVGKSIGLIYGYVNDGMYSVEDFDGYDAASETYQLRDGVADNSKVLGVTNLRPGYMKIKDLNNDGIIDSQDRTVIGNALPKSQGGFGLNATFRNFDASVFFNWSYGADVYNSGKIEFNQFYRTSYGNMLEGMSSDKRFTYIDVDGTYTGTPGEVVTDLEDLSTMNEGKTMWSNTSFGDQTVVLTDWAIEDGSYIRLNTLTLGYTLPTDLMSRIGVANARVYVTGYNLGLFTNYTGYDPEVSTTRRSGYQQLMPGLDYSAYPKSRSYTVGLNVTF